MEMSTKRQLGREVVEDIESEQLERLRPSEGSDPL